MTYVLTHQDRLLRLAEREIECPHANAEWHPDSDELGCEEGIWMCLDCWARKQKAYRPLLEHWVGGKGKGTRFPMLRQDCDYCEGTRINKKIWIEDHYEPNGSDCPNCQGRGWLPVDSEEATLEAMATVGLDGSWRAPHGIVPYWYVELDKDHEFAGRGKGATFNEALVQAFCEAVKWEGEA